MVGVKGRSGRKRNPRNAQRYINEQIDENYVELVSALIKKAKEGDREALFYCFDRRLGKPKAQTEVDLSGGETLGVGMIKQVFELVDKRRKELEEFKQLKEGIKREDE